MTIVEGLVPSKKAGEFEAAYSEMRNAPPAAVSRLIQKGISDAMGIIAYPPGHVTHTLSTANFIKDIL